MRRIPEVGLEAHGFQMRARPAQRPYLQRLRLQRLSPARRQPARWRLSVTLERNIDLDQGTESCQSLKYLAN